VMYDRDSTATIDLKQCHVCGADQRDGDKYCRHCGTRQVRSIAQDNVLDADTRDDISEPEGLVVVVDDDADLCESLKNLIRSVGLRVEVFTSAQELLDSQRPDVPSCLVLDVRLPGPSGLDLQKRMSEAQMEIPIIFMTGHADIPMTVQAMKAGAVEFLTKPFRDQDLLDAIQHALEHDRKAREQRKKIDGLRQRFDSLTQRERELMALMAQGYQRRQAA
jgi:FixJ family two-component response regulator